MKTSVSHRSASDKLATVYPFCIPERPSRPGKRSKAEIDRAWSLAVTTGEKLLARRKAGKDPTADEIAAAKDAVTAGYEAIEELLHGFRVDFRNRCWIEQASCRLVEVDRAIDEAFPDPEEIAPVVSLARIRKARRAAAKRADGGGAA